MAAAADQHPSGHAGLTFTWGATRRIQMNRKKRKRKKSSDLGCALLVLARGINRLGGGILALALRPQSG